MVLFSGCELGEICPKIVGLMKLSLIQELLKLRGANIQIVLYVRTYSIVTLA